MAKNMYQKREERRLKKSNENSGDGKLIKGVINWYPGHMAKAMREMQEKIKLVDCVIYVLDARAPISCINPKFDEMIKEKPKLYIINKIDLVTKEIVRKWLNYFGRQNKICIPVEATGNKEKKIIIESLKKLNKEKIDKYLLKGAIKSVRAMVVGVPNTGKSTLINSLCGEKKAVTGNRPGVTRGTQWVKLIDGIELLDTPGSLPPFFENQTYAMHLAFIGSIKEEVIATDDLAFAVIDFFRKNNTNDFLARYDILEFPDTNLEVYDLVAKRRGFIQNKDNYDYERTAKAIIDDVKKGRVGKICFDSLDEKI